MPDAAEVKRWRKEMRASLIARRMAADPRQRQAWSSAIERRLRPFTLEHTPGVVGFCWPFKAEFDPRPLVLELLNQGWQAALPAVVRPNAPLEFRPWSPDAEMELGIWDIPTPKTRETVLPTLALVPLVGFDSANYRLGYGGGYFDRTLAALDQRPYSIGIGYELGRLETVYPQPFDVPMTAIVTEIGVQQGSVVQQPGD
jgi:5-formyltetrahydrofolate cyclo-ligase